MRQALPGMAQDPDEFGVLLDLIETVKPESILEIGVWQGGTLARFAQRFPDANVIGIDPAPQVEGWPREWGTIIVGQSQDPTVRTAARIANGQRKYDLIHIDGNHAYGAVLDDWVWASNYGRVVAFHDISCINNDTMEVWRLWDQIRTHGAYPTSEIRFDGGSYGIGVVWL